MEKRDYVKINRARDDKMVNDEKERISNLIQNELYPEEFEYPLTLQFELTSRCNVYCKHCYNSSGEDNTIKDRMTPQEWKKFANYLVDKGGIFQAVISGGEPLLLGDDVFEIMDILHNDGTSFLVISNGFLLTQEKVDKFAKYRFKWFQVSIDGVNAEYHDEFRQREGSWERAVNAAYMVSKAGIPLTIAHSVTPGNLKDVVDMCELAYSLGAGSIILGEVNPSGRSANAPELQLSYEEQNHLHAQVVELSSKYSSKMKVERSSSTKNQLKRYMNTPNTGAIIRPNGDIRLDCMTPFIIGNVLDSDFTQLWQEKASTCWKHPKVIEYVEGFEIESDTNETLKNYYHDDILI